MSRAFTYGGIDRYDLAPPKHNCFPNERNATASFEKEPNPPESRRSPPREGYTYGGRDRSGLRWTAADNSC